MISKGKALVGPSYRLNPDSRSVFMRVLCLYGLNSWWESQESGAPASLTTLLLTNQGKIVFAQYTIRRKAKIFRSREDLISFEQAVALEGNLETAVASKDFDQGFSVYQAIRQE